MKKIILSALLTVLMLAVYGCGDNTTTNNTTSGGTGTGGVGIGPDQVGTDTNPIDLNTYNCAYDSWTGGYKLTNPVIDSEIAKKYSSNMDVLFYDNKDTWVDLPKQYNIYYGGDSNGTKYVIVKDTTLTGVLNDYFYFFNTIDLALFGKYPECAGITTPTQITYACISAFNNAGYIDKLAYTVDMDKLMTSCSQ